MAWVSLVATIVVVAFKLVAAHLSQSVSVLAEGIQSLADIMMSGLAIVALKVASRPPDEDHPYGHGKAELLASLVQVFVVLSSSLFILGMAWRRLMNPSDLQWDWGAAAMAYAVVSNLIVMRIVARAADQHRSATLRSEALHLKGDLFASTGVLLGMLLVGATGITLLDPILAAVFVIFAVWAAIKPLSKVIHSLMDGSIEREDLAELAGVLAHHPEVRGYHDLRSRWIGSLRHVELHVLLDDDLSFVAAHEIAEQIESELSQAIGGARVTIHYEPFQAELAHREQAHREGM
ncbi:MAG TPA: cation diffusion facilitator family transporter [Fimbriimonadaceae bacterium]|nr:cation diffusion facilitator family transporter [Fimbriimonadaceae bacterium]HRJ33437.1 cation diffusion facilitator family transporter [Fimbriimonadaceae bacterium]